MAEPKSTAGWLAGMNGGYSDSIGCCCCCSAGVAGKGAGGVVGRDDPTGGITTDWSVGPKRRGTSGIGASS